MLAEEFWEQVFTEVGTDVDDESREGTHADLVLAASMSCWAGEMILRETARAKIDALISWKAAKPYEMGE